MLATKILSKTRALRKELPVSINIPYSAHIDPFTVKHHSGDICRVFKLDGIAHESADDDALNTWHAQLNGFLQSLASSHPNIALWTHVIRRHDDHYPDSALSGFAQQLDAKYRSRCIEGHRLLINELYLTLVLRPATNQAETLLSKFESVSPEQLIANQLTALATLEELTQSVLSSLDRYGPRPLGCYQQGQVMFSEVLEFFGYLVNGEWQRMPLPRSNLRHAIATSRLHFGTEAIAFQTPTETIYAAPLTIKEYPSQTIPGVLNGLLVEPFEFVLTQSFVFTPKQAAKKLLIRDKNVKIAAGDLALSQIAELDDALDDLESNRLVFGDYHFSLLLLARTPGQLSEAVAQCRNVLADIGAITAREDIGNEAAFWAQLPGNFSFRPRPAPISSRNFAGLVSFHNFPSGQREGNHWGAAAAMLRTAANGPYHLSWHKGDKGSTQLIGPNGSGKTVTAAFLLTLSQKFAPHTFIFDKDRGCEILVRALGGRYQPLLPGQPTGFNPLQLTDTPSNRLFLQAWLRTLARPTLASEFRDLERALASTLALPIGMRRLSQLVNFLDPTQKEGIHARLLLWCEGRAYGWVFDNAVDVVDPQAATLFGYDMTELLTDELAREPTISYLLHRVQEVIDGRRWAVMFAEAWRYFNDPMLASWIENKLKTMRKQNGFLIFDTQSPADSLGSTIGKTIVNECTTLCFMPNPKANLDDHRALGLSDREIDIVKTLPENSRMFLVKQGRDSVVCALDLTGFDDELAILSSRTANLQIVNQLIETLGEDPAVWIPEFFQRRARA